MRNPLCQIRGDQPHHAHTAKALYAPDAKELTSDQELIGLLAKSSAEERVASLLLSLSSRLKRQHLSATQFRLPMSRADIGNYLGLTVETVSRVFSRFQSFDLILCDKKEIEIINLNGLSALAHKPKV